MKWAGLEIFSMYSRIIIASFKCKDAVVRLQKQLGQIMREVTPYLKSAHIFWEKVVIERLIRHHTQTI